MCNTWHIIPALFTILSTALARRIGEAAAAMQSGAAESSEFLAAIDDEVTNTIVASGSIQKQLASLAAQLQLLVEEKPAERAGLSRDVREQALRNAAKRGDAAAIERMLASNDTRVDAVSLFVDSAVCQMLTWATPLHLAAGGGHVEAVKVLLAAGASCDAALRSHAPLGQCMDGTVLHHACLGGSSKVVDLLLAEPASMLLSDLDRRELLLLAASKNFPDIFRAFANAFSEVREGWALGDERIKHGREVRTMAYLWRRRCRRRE